MSDLQNQLQEVLRDADALGYSACRLRGFDEVLFSPWRQAGRQLDKGC